MGDGGSEAGSAPTAGSRESPDSTRAGALAARKAAAPHTPADVSPETTGAGRQREATRKALKERVSKPRTPRPAKAVCRNEGEMKTFPGEQNPDRICHQQSRPAGAESALPAETEGTLTAQ